MKLKEAMEIIGNKPKGFMVHFEKVQGSILASDYFPDKHGGEALIKTELEAWELAERFAEVTFGKCIDIYVIDHTFSPVKDYALKKIINR